MKKIHVIAAASAATILLGAVGCTTAADTASYNVSLEAEQFRVNRRIVGINMITDKYLFVAEGKCSIERVPGELEVVCKIADDAFQKHFIEFSEGGNIAITVEQLETVDVSDYSYSFLFRPENVVPTVVR